MLTDWFPGDVKPVHVGYYERAYSYSHTAGFVSRNFWDGCAWRYVQGGVYAIRQDRPWRGFKEKPTCE
jgi:hypothetical protein